MGGSFTMKTVEEAAEPGFRYALDEVLLYTVNAFLAVAPAMIKEEREAVKLVDPTLSLWIIKAMKKCLQY